MTKLINWAQCPMGVKVLTLTDKSDEWVGELLGSVTNRTMLIKRTKLSESMGIDVVSIAPCLQKYLRLAPADHQPWLVYKEGVTVVPEWAECKYKITESADYGGTSYLDEVKILPEFYEENYHQYEIAHYRITGIKDGWTDNHKEAA
jgi:hypothetical protein